MIVALMIASLSVALMLPVTFRIGIRHTGRTEVRITMKYAFITKVWQSGKHKTGSKHSKGSGGLLGILRHAAGTRRFIRRHIHLDTLDVLVLLHTGDAARTAVLSGSLQSLANIPALRRRNIRIYVYPDFFRGYHTLQIRCILRVRLGILILTILMLSASRLQQKVRTAYGTPNW